MDNGNHKTIGSIQGMKGLAAFMVFLSHALCTPVSLFYEIKDTPWHLFYDGQIAVMIFIVIGGFFYYKEETPSIHKYLGGVKKKVLRIYPAFAITMILGYFICNNHDAWDKEIFTDWSNKFWCEKVELSELLKQLTILVPHDSDLINPPIWYIGMEVRLFLIIPLIIMLCNYIKYTNWILLIPLSLVCFFNTNFYSVCICGCLARIIYIKYKDRSQSNKIWYKLLKYSIPVFSVILLNSRNMFDISLSSSFGLQAIGASMIVLCISIYNYRFLSNKFLLWLGELSYEFYLCHFIVLMYLRSYYHDYISFTIICFIFSLILSFIIRACVKWLQRFFQEKGYYARLLSQ